MRLVIAIALVLSIAAPSAQADSLRCGERLVNVGDTVYEVVLKCGQPARRDVSVDNDVERWTYNLGPRDFIRVLTFVSGTLQHIQAGDYGR